MSDQDQAASPQHRNSTPRRSAGRGIPHRPARTGLALEALEERTLMSADPIVTLQGLEDEPLLGETVQFSVDFENAAATDAGYSPFVDVYFPASGADGDDGLSYVAGSARHLGTAIQERVLTFDETGIVTHPFAVNSAGDRLTIHGNAGDQLVVFVLPFGSFAADQPAARIDLAAKVSALADLDHDLTVTARGGFILGNDPLDNPSQDPSLLGAQTSAALSPSLLRLEKVYLGPENETATGSNFVRQYEIRVDIAAGQTLESLKLSDYFPANMAFVNVSYVTPGGSVQKIPASHVASAAPNNELTVHFPSVTGTASPIDLTMVVDFYIPRTNAAGGAVLNPSTGDDVLSGNQAQVTANWTPLDVRDVDQAGPVAVNPAGFEHVLTDKSIAVQKTVNVVTDLGAQGATPGDTLEHVLHFQISDFFSFDTLTLTDVFSDGQRLDPSFRPRFEILHHGTLYTGYFNADSTLEFTSALPDDLLIDLSQIGFDVNPATDGSTRLVFDVSRALVNGGAASGVLQGGQATGLNFGPTQGKVIFRTVIQDTYSDSYPSGRPRLDEADALDSGVVIRGRVLDNTTLQPTGFFEEDDSRGDLKLAVGKFTKTIYAVNGVVGAPAVVAPGDTVTYRLTYSLTSGDFEELRLLDYLPMPIFRAGDADANDVAGPNWTYDGNGNSVPASGSFRRGPADTAFDRSGIVPVVVADVTNNMLSFDYGTYEDGTNLPATIDLLFTVTATDDPFADQLLLTSQGRKQSQNTAESVLTSDAIAQVLLTQPVVRITKGVVATDNPNGAFTETHIGPVAFAPPGSAGPGFTGTIHSGSSTVNSGLKRYPIDSNIRRIDAGDTVTFAIVLENIGSSRKGAFDLQIRDLLPAGFEIPPGGLNLKVVDGTGAAIQYTLLGNGLFDPNGGIELHDGENGALSGFSATSGKNIAVILFDAQVIDTVQPREVLVNNAVLFNYAGVEGGEDHTVRDKTDRATVQVAQPDIVKQVIGSEFVGTGNGVNQAVVGEIVTYRVTIRIPEGNMINARLIDTMEPGLVFVDYFGFTSSAPGELSLTGNTNPSVQNGGTRLVWSLGDIVNANRDNLQGETITFTYRAVVTNVAGNQDGELLDNTIRMTWQASSVGPILGTQVEVVEPNVDVTIAPAADSQQADAGDRVTYEITPHLAAGSPDAYDATLKAILPVDGNGSRLLDPSWTVFDSAGLLTNADFERIGSDAGGWVVRSKAGVSFDLTHASGRVVKLFVSGTLPEDVQPGEAVVVETETRWSSLDGSPGAKSGYAANSVERTGADGIGGLNDYVDLAAGTLFVRELGSVKQIVATSESSTGNVGGIEQVAIGEIVRYRLIARLPEGSSPNLRMVDLLPEGMRFLADGTVKVALVADGGGITSGSLSGSGLQRTGSSSSIAPTYVLPSLAIQQTAVADGTELVFSLGDLFNADEDPNAEWVVLEFNALVENVVGNVAGTELVNTFETRVEGSPTAPSNPVTVAVVEPRIEDLAKSAVRPATDGTGTVYTLTFSNTGSATAFDVRIVDVLPAGTVLVPGSLKVTTNGVATGFRQLASPSTRLELAWDSLAVGASITVEYELDVIGPAAVRNNVATLTYTSLPGQGTPNNPTGSTVPGTTGAPDGERDGGDGAANGYSDEGSARTGYLGDTVWNDADGNGIRNGEPGLAGVTVELRGAGADGKYDTGDDTVATTVTDSQGKYLFQGVPLGAYRISVMGLSSAHTATYDLDGGTASPDGRTIVELTEAAAYSLNVDFGFRVDTDPVPPVDPPPPVVPVPNEGPFVTPPPTEPALVLPGLAFVNREADSAPAVDDTGKRAEDPGLGLDVGTRDDGALGGLDGSVFLDRNNNGVRDPDEPGVPGVAIRLDGPSTQFVYTDPAGRFAFENLPAGSYSLQELQPDGLLDGKLAAGSAGGATAGNVIDSIGLKAGERAVDYRFGELEPASITGTAFFDADGDGIRDPGEEAVPGVTVRLAGVDDRGRTVERTAKTDRHGDYAFTELRPGDYEVQQNDAAWAFLGARVDRHGIELAAGHTAAGNDFAETPLPGSTRPDGLLARAADAVLGAYDRWIGTPFQLARTPKKPAAEAAPAVPDQNVPKRAALETENKRTEVGPALPENLAGPELPGAEGVADGLKTAAGTLLFLSAASGLRGPHRKSPTEAAPAGLSWDELVDRALGDDADAENDG